MASYRKEETEEEKAPSKTIMKLFEWVESIKELPVSILKNRWSLTRSVLNPNFITEENETIYKFIHDDKLVEIRRVRHDDNVRYSIDAIKLRDESNQGWIELSRRELDPLNTNTGNLPYLMKIFDRVVTLYDCSSKERSNREARPVYNDRAILKNILSYEKKPAELDEDGIPIDFVRCEYLTGYTFLGCASLDVCFPLDSDCEIRCVAANAWFTTTDTEHLLGADGYVPPKSTHRLPTIYEQDWEEETSANCYPRHTKRSFIISSKPVQPGAADIVITSPRLFSTPKSCCLFEPSRPVARRKDDSVPRYTQPKVHIYSFAIYKNGVAQRDLVPMIDNNGIPCMFDKVSKQPLYPTSGDSLEVGFTREQLIDLHNKLPRRNELDKGNLHIHIPRETTTRDYVSDSAVYLALHCVGRKNWLFGLRTDTPDDVEHDVEYIYLNQPRKMTKEEEADAFWSAHQLGMIKYAH